MMAAVVVLLVVALLMTSSTYSSSFETCPKCGDKEVPYPLSTTKECGDPNYSVYCNNNVLEFRSASGSYYEILSIDPGSYALVIRVPTIDKDHCYSSDLMDGGFRVDDNSPFNISKRNTVMLLNCSENILLSPLNCSSNSPCRLFEKEKEGGSCLNTLCCSYLKDSAMTSRRIRLRVGGCTAYTSVIDFKVGDSPDLWNYGIELQWLPPPSLRAHRH